MEEKSDIWSIRYNVAKERKKIIQEVTTTKKIVLVFRMEKTIEFEAKRDRHRNMLIKFQKTN